MKKLLIIILLFASSLYSQIVVDIEVKGNKLVDKTLITAASGLAVGKEFTSEIARDGIKKLYALGLFRDITIDSERKGGGIKVIIQVEEYPRVSRVEFVGNKKIKDKKLNEVCGIKKGDIASDRRIFDGKVNILKEYKDKGHFLVEVEPKTEMTEDGMIIRFFVTEKVNLRIRQIEIIGNNAFPDKAVEKTMQNREKTWYRKAIFNGDKFEEDKDKIKQFYAERGFPNAEIKNIEFIQLNGSWVKIEITIDEGKKLYFGDASFSGNKIIPDEILYKCIKFKKDNVYNNKKLQESTQSLYEIYGDLGYLYLYVNVEEELNDSIVNIIYNIKEGNPARVHYIWVKGNTKTHEKVIRRELTIFPGDILRRNELIRSQRKVYNLGFFSNLTLDTRVVNDSGDIDLIFNIEEKQAGQFSVGIGYSAETKFTGNVSISIPNLRGLGELLYIRADKGSKYTNYELGFREPWL
ncbi:MAG: outer membrane protein assembly factor BamA, partial [bacterium]|nr:outer membrane protein assembly factor BamA [bacterium]